MTNGMNNDKNNNLKKEHLLYVSVDGNDENDGSIEKPFASVEHAKNIIRIFKKTFGECNFTVFIRGGTYYLDNTIIFGVEDSGNESHKITYKAYPGERVIFSSGKKISNWVLPKEEIKGLNTKAIGKVWVSEIPEVKSGKWNFYSLFDGEKRLPRSRSEGFAPVNEGAGWQGSDMEHTSIQYPTDAPFREWENIEDIEVIVRSIAVWQMSILPLTKVDMVNQIATVSIPSLYLISQMWYWLDKSKSIWIENAVDFIDEPGKWALDRKEGKLYYWPLNDRPSDELYAPLLKEYIKIEGALDVEYKMDIPVTHLELENLEFIHGERDTWPENYRGYELQHSWDLYDRDNSVIRLRGAEQCAVKNCKIHASNGGAIRLDLYCKNNTITNNMIYDIGGAGITLAGYGPGTKDVNTKNLISNNSICDIGKIYWHSLGIFVWQSSENTISNNLIHDVPYTAIAVSGRIVFTKAISECSKTIRWFEIDGNPEGFLEQIPYLHSRDNLVTKNEIYNAVQVMGDGDGIYISGAGKGNKILNNYIHDCPSEHLCDGIRCDDIQIETLIECNIVHKMGGLGTGICIKGKNDIINNIISCPNDQTTRGFISMELGPVDGSIVKNNIFYSKKKEQTLYYIARTYGDGPLPEFSKTKSDYNLYFNEDSGCWADDFLEEARKSGVELNSIQSNPMFIDIENSDFKLNANSPAHKLGINEIDINEIGLK